MAMNREEFARVGWGVINKNVILLNWKQFGQNVFVLFVLLDIFLCMRIPIRDFFVYTTRGKSLKAFNFSCLKILIFFFCTLWDMPDFGGAHIKRNMLLSWVLPAKVRPDLA